MAENTTSEVTHTKLPWHTGPDTLVGAVWIYSECYPVAEPVGSFDRARQYVKNALFRLRGDAAPHHWKDDTEVRKEKHWATVRANAEFIVRACNNFDAMLAALKEFVELFRDFDMRPEDECHELYCKFLGVIAEAESERADG